MDPNGDPLEELEHSADGGKTREEAKMADEKNMNTEETVEDVFNTLTEKQKNVVYAIIGSTMASEDDGEEDDTVKQNVFDKDTHETVLKHSMDEINNIVKTAKSHGSMKQAFEDAMDADELAHSIDNVEWLFPDDHVLDTPPHVIDNDQTWVGKVMNGVHHIPFSRIKSMSADLTEEDARAKGYIKGNFKKEQAIWSSEASTSPTTVYKEAEDGPRRHCRYYQF